MNVRPKGSALPGRFIIFALGRGISALGDSLGGMAILWLVAVEWEQAAAFAAIGAAFSIVRVLLGPLAGAFADHCSNRTVMVAAEVLQACMSLGAGWLAATGLLTLPAVAGLMSIKAVAGLFFGPSARVYVSRAVAADALSRANGLQSGLGRIGGIAGPLLAGLVVEGLGISWAFALDGLSFFLSAAVCLAVVPATRARASATTDSKGLVNIVQASREGIRTVWQNRPLRTVALTLSLVNMNLSGAMYAVTVFAPRVLKADAAGVGLLQSSIQAGVLIGSAALTLVRIRASTGVLAMAPVVLTVGVILMGVGFVKSLPVLTALMLAYGLAISVTAVAGELYYQTLIPVDIRGRVMSVSSTIESALQPAGSLAAGLLLEAGLYSALFLGAGGVCIFLAVPLMRSVQELAGLRGSKETFHNMR